MRKSELTFYLWPIPLFAAGLVLFNLVLYLNHEPHNATFVALLLPWLGFIPFCIAKWSVIRRGVKHSFGSAQMSMGYKFLYWMGYTLMITGVVFGVFLIRSAHTVKNVI